MQNFTLAFWLCRVHQINKTRVVLRYNYSENSKNEKGIMRNDKISYLCDSRY